MCRRPSSLCCTDATPFTAVNGVLNDAVAEMDAALDEYENEMLNEDYAMQWGLSVCVIKSNFVEKETPPFTCKNQIDFLRYKNRDPHHLLPYREPQC